MTTRLELESARRRLRSDNAELVDAATDALRERNAVEARVQAFLKDLDGAARGALEDDLQAAMAAIYGGDEQPPTDLGPVLEAVVIGDGSRPVFWLQNDRLAKLGQPTGKFVDLLEQNAALVEAAALSVGRIETDDAAPPPGLDKAFVGTAFLVADNLAITNRHVIEAMVDNPGSTDGPFNLRATYWLNLAAQYGTAASRRFRIERVLFAGGQPIGAGGDIGRLDLAMLEIGAAETLAMVRPSPLALTGRKLLTGEQVVVVGYPAKPRIWYGPGEPPGAAEVEDILVKLFDSRFGYKRCASGEIDAIAGFQGDAKGWTVKHDASTLGGNSGSPILTLRDGGIRVSALHFGGLSRQANYGHAMEKLAGVFAPFGLTL
jgi:hypothetical protein